MHPRQTISSGRNPYKRINQLMQICYYMQIEPDRTITIVSPRKEHKKEFLAFAAHHKVVFTSVGRQKKWGKDAWCFTVKGFEYKSQETK